MFKTLTKRSMIAVSLLALSQIALLAVAQQAPKEPDVEVDFKPFPEVKPLAVPPIKKIKPTPSLPKPVPPVVIGMQEAHPVTVQPKICIMGALVVGPNPADPYEPITAGCSCIVPTGADVDVKLTWTLDDDCKGIPSADNVQYYIWSPPGDHEISVTVEAKIYQTINIVVPDPKDATKTTTIPFRGLVDMTRDTYNATFTVTSPTPPVPPVTPPAPDIQSALAGVKSAVAAGDPVKAATFASAWGDFLSVMRGNAPKTKGEFKTSVAAFMNAAVARANLQGAFPGFSAALEQGMVSIFTDQDGALDSQKAIDFVSGLVWACTPTVKPKPPKVHST